MNSLLRMLPSVSHLLESDIGKRFVQQYGHDSVADVFRGVLDETRQMLLNEQDVNTTNDALLNVAASQLKRQFAPLLRPVINATGVILHTNLGRAPLSDEAIMAMGAIAKSYNTLEFDLDSGGRGSRNVHAGQVLSALTGAESTLVVNNCASALVLVLSALARDKAVIVSRGQLVEIGGGFRIPEIMVQGGAKLVEVGTTNKTRVTDYVNAISDETAMLLRVHSSNFKQVGFTESVMLAEMATVAHEQGVFLVDDIGSGALLDTGQFGLEPEPTVQASIAAGADLVLFSGDKLLGAPQSGIIVGKRDLIDRLKQHPFSRALRADKITLAGLLATLEHYRRGEALEKIPIWWMMSRELCDLGRIAKRWSKALPHADIQKGESTVGGGSIPGSTLPTVLLALDVSHPDDFMRRLREAETPIIARIADNRVLLDPRTVFPEQEDTLLNLLLNFLTQV